MSQELSDAIWKWLRGKPAEHGLRLLRRRFCKKGKFTTPRFLASADFQWQRDCSEATAREIDLEVKNLLDRCYAEAKELLTVHRDQLEHVTGELIHRETISGAEFYRMIGLSPPEPKTPIPTSIPELTPALFTVPKP